MNGNYFKAFKNLFFLILLISIICGKMLRQSTGLILLIYHLLL